MGPGGSVYFDLVAHLSTDESLAEAAGGRNVPPVARTRDRVRYDHEFNLAVLVNQAKPRSDANSLFVVSRLTQLSVTPSPRAEHETPDHVLKEIAFVQLVNK